jgi:hypothetical protein
LTDDRHAESIDIVQTSGNIKNESHIIA